ncbi:hypothetical protein [Thermomonospora umbrina]|uniref:hypothetical protein n=1 Tax=Thermomonospora umbrina TaxID=111806 RepID=UPI001FE3D13A|nr:hypothetical protein [Thermomonospora umbrina]
MSTPPTPQARPAWTGPQWDDPVLTRLAGRLREAHRLVAPLPSGPRRRLIRHLLMITDLAKRDSVLADRRLEAFLTDFTHRVRTEGDEVDTSGLLASLEGTPDDENACDTGSIACR